MNGEAMVIQREPISRKMKKAFRKLLSRWILWVSVAVIAMIAVPTTVLALGNNRNMAVGRPLPCKA